MKFLICLLFLFPLSVFSIKKQALELAPGLKENYLALLKQATDFHEVIIDGDKNAIQREIKETQEIIAKLYRQLSSIPKFHHRIHSHKLLKSIEEQLAVMDVTNSLNKENETKDIKRLFNSFFELAQVYDLKKDMKNKIFYCSKDKSLWFQENGKAKNPVNPNYKNCGRLIL